jgi:hypothetical protein
MEYATVIKDTGFNEDDITTLLRGDTSKKYNEMIDIWKASLEKTGINYMAVEYPMFAVKGNYQNAINFKPYFIECALRACYPRSVLYIDGDMFVNKYPALLEAPGLDYAARGWAIDLHPSKWTKPCFDPYIFETSGGTMFFGQTLMGYELLDKWQVAMSTNKGKAEDRVLSLIINSEEMITRLSMIELPIEYLWLSLLYNKDVSKFRQNIFISHPYCLTEEEDAIELSDELLQKMKNREPENYIEIVSDNYICNRKNDCLYEYIYFSSKKLAEEHSDYMKWLAKYGSIKVIEFNEKYGKYNKIAEKNSKLVREIELKSTEKIVVLVDKDDKINTGGQIIEKTNIIATILAFIKAGQNVLYIPPNCEFKRVKKLYKILKENPFAQLICKNVNKDISHYSKNYMLKIDESYPIYISAENPILFHLLMMSENFAGINEAFNSSFIFITRTRCLWL